MEAVEFYAKEFMEFKEKFEAIGFELVGSKTNSGVIYYIAKERKAQ